MSQLKEIQSRVQGVKNTKQITRAMKMISAVKLRKAQERIMNLRAYADGIFSTMVDVASTQRVEHPLLKRKKEETLKPLFAVLSSDRGLCGSFNYGVCRAAENLLKEKSHDYFLIGRKAVEYFRFRNYQPVEHLTGLDRELSFPLAAKVAHFLMEAFKQGSYDEVTLIYQTFESAVSQKITISSFLPIDLTSTSSWKDTSFSEDLIFENSPEELVESLIQKHFNIQVYRAMCESLASEHGARMCAMENATKNAEDIEAQLQLQFNKMRQSSITTELIEVTSGAEAMNA